MESKDLDKLFQDAFQDAQETPNGRVWEGIEQELAKEKKVIPFYIKYRTQLSIAATFLLFFGAGLTFYKKPIPSGNKQIEEVLNAMEKQTVQRNSKTNESEAERSVETPTNTLPTIVETPTLANSSQEKQIKEEVFVEVDNSDDNIEQEIQKEEIVKIENNLSSVEADVEISQPYFEEVKNLDPISNDEQPTFAYTVPQEENKSSLVTRLLNGITKNIISKNIDIREDKEIEFRNDDEGSITLNIINSFARK
jgi:hypothetical protein